MFKKSLLSILLILLTSSFVSAEVFWLDNNISLDTSNPTYRVGRADECGANLPPEYTCDLTCFSGVNDAAKVFTCTVGMTALYYEEFEADFGDELMSAPELATATYRSGNSLETLDVRSVIFYPYQAIRLCFNLGRPLTTQNVNWVLAEGYPTAEVDPAGCMATETALW